MDSSARIGMPHFEERILCRYTSYFLEKYDVIKMLESGLPKLMISSSEHL